MSHIPFPIKDLERLRDDAKARRDVAEREVNMFERMLANTTKPKQESLKVSKALNTLLKNSGL